MKLRRSVLLAMMIAVPCAVAIPRSASAIWPPTPEMTPDDLSHRENQPNDPGYETQWEHWSFIPGANLTFPMFRLDEVRIGAGNNTDRAWALTTGDPRTLIAVLDSGINWDNTDLANKIALNTRELPLPMGATNGDYDTNADGVVNIKDWARDSRIPCGTGDIAHRDLRQCRGPDGMPNDPNRNGILDAGDLIRIFSDGTDDDHNGYTDDIAGWDFFQDDNDPADATRFGHGTGEARWSSAETNNNEGDAGDCPRCMVVPVRVADSFIGEVNDFAQGVVYATDRGVSVVQEALGTIDNSTFAMNAIEYAYTHGVAVIASAADENSRHHNVPGTNNHTLYVHAIRYDGENITRSTTFLNFNNCTNYGAQLQLSVSGTGCSSEATGHTAGHAGLLYSLARTRNLSPTLSAEEVYQLLQRTTDDIDIPESRPGNPHYDDTKYPSLPGWDQRFGYGRSNIRRALEWLRDGKLPPEVSITSPRWFTVLNPARDTDRVLRIEGHINARRAPRFDYTVEWAPGVEPADTAWHTVREERNVTAAVNDRLAELDLSSVTVDNPGEVENRYTITVRVRVTAHYDGTIGDVPGEARRAFSVHRDDSVLPGFPLYVGASGESSARLVDLDGDNIRDVVYATSDGVIHALKGDGTPLRGWPVHTDPQYGQRESDSVHYTRSAAYQGTPPAIDPSRVYDPIIASPGIADLDGDGHLEVVVAAYHGTVYVFRHDGTPYGHGFPFALPDVPSESTSPTQILQRGIFGSPVLYDLDHDSRPEVIFGAMDGNLYALDGVSGEAQRGFPVLIHFPEAGTEHNRVFGSVGVGNFDGDNTPDLVVVSNERLRGDNNSGAVYLVHGDGMLHPGGPYHHNWPIAFTSFNFFPLVGEGISGAPAIADIDGDGRDELALTGNALPTIVLARGTQPDNLGLRPAANTLAHISLIRSAQRGPLSNYRSNIVSFANVFSLGSFGDLDNDTHPDFTTTGSELALAINLAGGGRARPFSHLIGAWNATTGNVFPGFPRVIEDYTFFMNSSIADVGGDAYPEVIVGTAGYYLHAFDACGREPDGWPKFTGQWVIPAPTVGDINGDHTLDLVSGTRGGWLWAWRTPSDDRTSSIQWEGFRHDSQNTGNYGTPLTQGRRTLTDTPVLQCPVPTTPDAGTLPDDASVTTTDATVTADGAVITPPSVTGDGCGCRTSPGLTDTPAGDSSTAWLGLTLGVMALALSRRRRSA